jgi:hypothetical protein
MLNRPSLSTRQIMAGRQCPRGVEVDLATLVANGRKHLFWAAVQGGWLQRLDELDLP